MIQVWPWALENRSQQTKDNFLQESAQWYVKISDLEAREQTFSFEVRVRDAVLVVVVLAVPVQRSQPWLARLAGALAIVHRGPRRSE